MTGPACAGRMFSIWRKPRHPEVRGVLQIIAHDRMRLIEIGQCIELIVFQLEPIVVVRDAAIAMKLTRRARLLIFV